MKPSCKESDVKRKTMTLQYYNLLIFTLSFYRFNRKQIVNQINFMLFYYVASLQSSLLKSTLGFLKFLLNGILVMVIKSSSMIKTKLARSVLHITICLIDYILMALISDFLKDLKILGKIVNMWLVRL